MKIALLGHGKMGKAIESEALKRGHEVVLVITSQNQSELTPESLRQADVAIEVSKPETAFRNVAACLEAGVPVVSGTTAWLDELPKAIELCEQQKGALLYASNFSIGVNIVFEVNKLLAKLMSPHADYKVQIKEIHHTQKLDAPSGTAITMAKGILENHPGLEGWYLVGEGTADDQSIAITAERKDEVPGTHILEWRNDIDSITLSHVAHNRLGFANGAVTAAEWMVGKKGFFGMRDVLGI